MHIGRKNIERTYKLASVEGIIDLVEVDNECDLGIHFLSYLQFDKQVTDICAKANRTFGIIKHTFSRMKIDMLRILFDSLVRPILVYCSSVWSPYSKVSARKIEQIQSRATIKVENLKDVSYSDQLRIICIPTLQSMRLRTDMIQVYEIFNGYEDTVTVTVDSHSYTRGHPFNNNKMIRGNTLWHFSIFSYSIFFFLG